MRGRALACGGSGSGEAYVHVAIAAVWLALEQLPAEALADAETSVLGFKRGTDGVGRYRSRPP